MGFIRELIYRIAQRYNIDPDRIYVAGYSAGAAMAYLLGSELSDVLAAIAPISGQIGGRYNATSPLELVPEPKQPVPAIAFWGTDETDYYKDLELSYGRAKTIGTWVKYQGCNETPSLNTTSPDGKVIKTVYSGGKGGSEVILYSSVGGTHVVPTIAPALIWDFFKSHPKQH